MVPLPLLRDEPIMIQGKPLDLPLEPIELLKPLDQLMTARCRENLHLHLHALFGRRKKGDVQNRIKSYNSFLVS